MHKHWDGSMEQQCSTGDHLCKAVREGERTQRVEHACTVVTACGCEAVQATQLDAVAIIVPGFSSIHKHSTAEHNGNPVNALSALSAGELPSLPPTDPSPLCAYTQPCAQNGLCAG